MADRRKPWCKVSAEFVLSCACDDGECAGERMSAQIAQAYRIMDGKPRLVPVSPHTTGEG